MDCQRLAAGEGTSCANGELAVSTREAGGVAGSDHRPCHFRCALGLGP